MIDIKIDGSDKISIISAGDMAKVLTELCLAVRLLHNRVEIANPEAGWKFKRTIMMELGDPKSPVWTVPIPKAGEGISIVMPVREVEG